MIEKGIAVIDADSIIFHGFHPNKVLDEESKQPVKIDGKFQYYEKTDKEIEESIDYLLNKIIIDTQCSGYICFVKGKNTTNSRKYINPEYKLNRNKESPKFWEFTKNYLIKKWNVVEVNDIEVDDAVNITRLQIPNSFITALDKDLLSLEGCHYNWNKGKWIEVNKSEADYKFWSDMIVGQPGDNIKGLPGKGEKYVEKIFINNDLRDCNLYSQVVLKEYIQQLGEERGIQEFYSNYKCLKLLSNYEGFIIPEINLINKEEEW